MEEEAARVEPAGSATASTHTLPQENQELLIPSFSPSSAPSSPTPTGTLSRLGLKSPTGPAGAVAPGSPVDRGQVSAITVVALLDKLVNMMEAVQENQQRMEQRQSDLEGAVRMVQGDVTRLAKTHAGTSNCVGKLLERSRKVSVHLKEVKDRLDKQGVQVKKLEANHSHLLKRNHFKVVITQEDNEIPSTVFVKDSLKTPLPSLYDAESTMPPPSVTGSVDGVHAQDEGLQSVNLSSDEDESLSPQHFDPLEVDEAYGVGTSRTYERRADRFKRSSLKKVDSLKKAFTRESIEKKVNQFTSKIVPPEKREKLKKSLTPNHPKSPTAKSSSFKVTPMTFNIKKVREGELPSQDASFQSEGAHVEIPPLEVDLSPGDVPSAEVHAQEVVGEVQEALSSPDEIKAEVSINGETPSLEVEVNGDRSAGLAVPEQDDDIGEEEVEEEKEQQKSPVEAAAEVVAEATTITSTITVEQVS